MMSTRDGRKKGHGRDVHSRWKERTREAETQSRPWGGQPSPQPPLPLPRCTARVAALPPAPQQGPSLTCQSYPQHSFLGAALCGAYTRKGHRQHVAPQNTPSVAGSPSKVPKRAGGNQGRGESALPLQHPPLLKRRDDSGSSCDSQSLLSLLGRQCPGKRELSPGRGPGMQRNW